MIVDQDQRAGVNIESTPKDLAWIDRKAAHGSACDDFIGEQPIAPIEEHHAQLLDPQVGHRGDQIIDQRLVGPGDRPAADAFAQAEGNCFADRCQGRRREMAVADNLLKDRLGLRQSTTQTMEFGD